MRWVRESINSFVPVGGDVAAVRLAHLQGMPVGESATSIVVDVTVGVVTQLIFVVVGAGLLLTRSNGRGALIVVAVVSIGTVMLGVATAAFVMFQHRGLFGFVAKIARRLPGDWQSAFATFASAIDDALVAAYRRRRVIFRAAVFRLVGWVVGSGEIWLALHSLGHPASVVDAFILESLGAGVRAVAFMVPVGLGALEGGFVLFGALLGLPADTALAVSLSKRVRELAWGVPGLLVWQWIEGHQLLRRVRA